MSRSAKPRRGRGFSLRELFDDLSFAQVAAGALAAVTSMLLASQIGVAGSLIGAAVGSVVAAVTSQIYKKCISASARRLRDIPHVVGVALERDSKGEGYLLESVEACEGAVVHLERLEARDLVDGELACAATELIAPVSDEAKRRACADAAVFRGNPRDVACGASGGARASEAGHRDVFRDEGVYVERAMRERARRRRRVVAVSVVSALVAVALSALFVSALTDGAGLGVKPEPAPPPSSCEQEVSPPVPSPQNDGVGSPDDGSSSFGTASSQAATMDASSASSSAGASSSAAASSDAVSSSSSAPEDSSPRAATGEPAPSSSSDSRQG